MEGKETLDNSFESKEDDELYRRLMNERRRIQSKADDKKRHAKAVKVQQKQAQKLEEREKGFQLHFAGANEERLEEARRRQQQAERRSGGYAGSTSAPRPSSGERRAAKEWQVETVELRGKDGEIFRCSPNGQLGMPASQDEDEIDEELPDPSGGEEFPDEGSSRPSTGGSAAGVDQDTRGVLRMMNLANQDQLTHLRESLTNQIDTRVPSAGSGLPPQPRLSMSGRNGSAKLLDALNAGTSRPSSGSRPPSNSSAAIANAIQAENARVKKLSEGSTLETEASLDMPRPPSADAEKGSSRPPSSSRSSSRLKLPLGPEEAAGLAPPSALDARVPPSSSRSRLLPPMAGGYPSSAVSSQAQVTPRPEAPQVATFALPSGEDAQAEASRLPEKSRAPEPIEKSARVPEADARPFSDELVDRVSRLDQRKQKALLRVLESLEAGDSEPASSSTSAPKPVEASAGTIRLRVVSSWGDARQCGLSRIEALTASGEVIRIPRAALSLHGTQGGSTTLGRVLEGQRTSTHEKHMWLGTTCPTPAGTGFEPFELSLNLPESLPSVAALRLWNFNSPDGLSKGAREVEVWRGNSRVWSGELPIGTGGSEIMPIVAPLLPGFDVSAAMLVVDQDLASASDQSPVRATQKEQKDKPIWLDGMPKRPDFDVQEDAEDDDFFEMSPDPKGRNSAPPRDEQSELMQSLHALEVFRSSQSRRFFGQRGRSDSQAKTAEDWRAPEAQSPSAPSAMIAALGDEDICNTAQFGSPALAREQDLLAEAAAMGLEIPVRSFDDHDLPDGMACDEPPNVMGSSLLASQFSMMQSVVIPTLPSGRSLVFNCVSTWGDQNFVGLAGIEIFDGRGFPVVMKDPCRQVSADPHSINVLGEYEHDPRTPDKLFDQVNLTRDDLHVWLAPFSPGRAHTITVDLERKTEICMIRVWNYNKSRLHSSRGVRDMEILLDGLPIFTGEVRRAPGVLTAPEEACEHILFTQDEDVLEGVAEHDWLPAHLPVDSDEEEEDEELNQVGGSSSSWGARPPTADLKAGRVPPSPRGETTPRTGMDGRPMTRANMERQRAHGSVCSSVTIVIHSTWGDQFYVGLTALEILDGSLAPIPLREDMVDAYPRDLNDLEGVEGDLRTLSNILDGVCCTTDDKHMWLAPFLKVGAGKAGASQDEAPRNILRIDFGAEKREVAGFNMWNYNKNIEDACRGIREFSVYCDDRFVATFLCRKAPGHVHFDFKQVVLLDQPPCMDSNMPSRATSGVPPMAPRMPSRSGSRRTSEQRPSSRSGRPPSGAERRPSSRERGAARPDGGAIERAPSVGPASDGRVQQQYETPLHPCGFTFKVMLTSTWNDAHYIGLDGVEFYDLAGKPLRPKRAHSNHGSVKNLPGMGADVRTEDVLTKGAPGNSSRMWLGPLVRQPPNFVELIFDEPTHVSCMRFWNYSRTPGRGARDIDIYVDDLLIYQGILRQAPSSSSTVSPQQGESILFTAQPEIVERERSLVYVPRQEDLLTFFDESGRWDQQTGSYVPGTSPLERPMTSVIAR